MGPLSDTRLRYWNLDDDSALYLVPTSYKTFTASTELSRPYSFELPATLPGADIQYWYAAWYDDADNELLMFDSTDPAVVASAEYNRLAIQDTVDSDNAPITIAIQNFQAETDLSGNPTGNYKYTGYDGASGNYMLTLDADSSGGFDFTIAATSGW